VADLASQYTSITAADMTNILNASSDVIAPYSATTLKSVVSELSIDGQGQATVVWSSTLNGTALTVGQTVNVPSALAVPNSYLLLGQATYGYVVTGTLTLSDGVYMRPRQSSSVSYTN
jgi:Flp pilus assembly protein TadG